MMCQCNVTFSCIFNDSFVLPPSGWHRYIYPKPGNDVKCHMAADSCSDNDVTDVVIGELNNIHCIVLDI